jgi:hypothetical protein
MDWFTPSTFNFLEQSDSDLGGSGTLLVPGTRILLAAGKDGKIYVTDKGNLGHQTTNDSQAIQVLPVTVPGQNGLAPHIHGTPAHWNSTAGSFVYVMAEQDPLRQYRINADKLEAFRLTTIRAPVDPTRPVGFTMPGGIVSISADGDAAETGIAWVTMPIDGDANQKTVTGVLRAFRASDVSAAELWNSQTDAKDAYGNYAKYNPATVYNGRVYVPTFSDQFCVYGLR